MTVPTPFQPPSDLKKRRSNPLPTPIASPFQPPSNPVFQPPSPKGEGYKASRPQARSSSLCVLSDEIAALARRVRRLTVSHRHPERFHEEKSEIEHQLHCLARSIHPNPTKG
jgi:hypothetical protein